MSDARDDKRGVNVKFVGELIFDEGKRVIAGTMEGDEILAALGAAYTPSHVEQFAPTEGQIDGAIAEIEQCFEGSGSKGRDLGRMQSYARMVCHVRHLAVTTPSTTPQTDAALLKPLDETLSLAREIYETERGDRASRVLRGRIGGWTSQEKELARAVLVCTPSATERNAVIEECAAIADYLYENGADTDGSVLLVDCSNKIRDLKNRADGGKQTDG